MFYIFKLSHLFSFNSLQCIVNPGGQREGVSVFLDGEETRCNVHRSRSWRKGLESQGLKRLNLSVLVTYAT